MVFAIGIVLVIIAFFGAIGVGVIMESGNNGSGQSAMGLLMSAILLVSGIYLICVN